jgi:Tfp pilus tip-associated adhesin PilY1
MGKKIITMWVLILCQFLFISGVCRADESEIFSISVAPDALILLDLSGSMGRDPAGASCYTSGCSKLEMAKNAVHSILDDNGDGVIDDKDETSLAIRIGYMRYYDCQSDDAGGSYSSGCNSLRNAISNTDPPPYSSPSRYSDIWSNVLTESAGGGTPLASALDEAKLYLDAHKSNDSAKACRQKYVILITDGQDTYACGGDGSETQSGMYMRRKATVAKAKALKDAGYKVYVIGFGANMPAELMNTLNWSAYYGGTDNPSATKSDDTGAVTPSANPCGEGSSNDPGQSLLSGYAFMATNASEIADAIKAAFGLIGQSRMCFSVASVAASRVSSENFLYEASFKPNATDPFWPGYLKKYSVNADGSVGSVQWDAGELLKSKDPSTRQIFTYLSGTVTPFVSGAFSTAEQAKKYLNVDTGSDAGAVVGYFRGESSFNRENWKLGDIFHSNPITVGSPSPYFKDIRSPKAFTDFRKNNASRDRIVAVGANDGQFRVFSGSDGSERWSFIPPNLLAKLKYISHPTHPSSQAHTYFLDGPVTVADVWLGNGDDKSKAAADWRTLLVFGEGKGVRDAKDDPAFLWSSSSSCDSDFGKEYSAAYPFYCGYYALDVTDTSLTQPVLKWRLNFPSGGPQTQAYLGEPWSRMAFGKVILNGSEKWVGFIGGGYSKDGDKGKGFFVVDLSNGAVIWSFTKGDSDTGTTSSKMDYPLPASPTIVDTDLDGFVDTAYLGDLGGNMWRFKFCPQGDDNSCNTANWSGGLLFQASSGFRQPIYTTATVAITPKWWIFWGTGEKENPTGVQGTDHFFALMDNDRSTTYTISNFQDLSTQGSLYSGTQAGWYVTLGARGEKALSDPTVFGGMVLFATYTPPSAGSDACSKTGTGNLYALAILRLAIGGYTFDAGAGLMSLPSGSGDTTGGARSITVGSGIAKSPIISQKPAPGGPTDLYVPLSGGGGQDAKLISSAQLGSTPLTDRLQITAPTALLHHWKDKRIQ